jgi:uncharacterized integral membrane protein (TIGR00698 family)
LIHCRTCSRRRLLAAALLVTGGALSLLPQVTAAAALALGILIGLATANPHAGLTGRWAGKLLRASVIGLGFGMSLSAVAAAAAQGLAYTVAGVIGSFAVGLLLGRLFRVERAASLLVASGTSICGGSAIAAVGSAIRAKPETIAAALGIVFILNAVAIYTFPPAGRALGLSESQFAIWAAVAIHDTSSVVAAASAYGRQALEEATVLKLARTLWIIPLVIGAAWWARRHEAQPGAAPAAVHLPWFPLLFLAAVVVRTVAPGDVVPLLAGVAAAARALLPLVLFLIGSSLTGAALRSLGPRPLLQAAVLWVAMSAAVLTAVLTLAA